MSITHSTVVAIPDDGTSPVGSDEWNAAHVATDQAIVFLIDGAGAEIADGVKGDIVMPFTGTFVSWTLLADTSGSVVIDLWRDSYANYPPTAADAITGSEHPTITTAVKATSSALTGWTTAFTKGDVLRINVDSCTSITRLTLALAVTEP